MHFAKPTLLGTMGLLVGLASGRAAPEPEMPLLELAPLIVSATRMTVSDIEGPQSMDSYDAALIDSSGAFSVSEFIDSLPAPDDETPTLVLIDGRPTYLDPASLPLGMIAEIEVSTEGSMPQYGEFHNGRIINIRLKPNYTALELGAKFEGTEAGGGAQRKGRLSGASTRKKLRTIYSLEFNEREPLLATQRDFSREQDHRSVGGRDLRLAWGQPAVVVAGSGVLAGVTDASGHPVRTALVPRGQNGAGLTPTDFLPPDATLGDQPNGQQRFNTADYRWLVSPSQSISINLGCTYAFSDSLRLSVNGSHQESSGERLGTPPVSVTSSDTLVPAAFNPFNQDVWVGMVHEGFGPTRQETRAQRDQIGIDLDGDLPGDWRWEASAGFRRNTSQRTGDELDPAKLSLALAAEDPTRRFNPFADIDQFDPNTELYPLLTATRMRDDTSHRLESELSVRGTPLDLPGGPVRLALKARYRDDRRERSSTRVLGQDPETDRFAQSDQRFTTTLQLPWIGSDNAISLIHRLETQFTGKVESSSKGAREIEGDAGVVWAPWRSLFFRARIDLSVETPARKVIAGSETIVGETLIDPWRGGEPITAVRVFNQETIAAGKEKQRRYSFGVGYEPPAFPGLELKVNYRARTQSGIFQDNFKAQDIVSNELAFADRVQRGDPTEADLVTGQPGRIVAVDLTPGSTGEAVRREVEFEFTYRLPEQPSGTWRITVDIDRTLSTRYEVMPGVAYVSEGRSRYRRPPWRADARMAWSRGLWNASAHLRHTEALPATEDAFNGIDPSTTVDLNFGRRWLLREEGQGGKRRELKLVLGVDNVFDKDPPWADTVTGYQGGSPLGRTYSGAITLEF